MILLIFFNYINWHFVDWGFDFMNFSILSLVGLILVSWFRSRILKTSPSWLQFFLKKNYYSILSWFNIKFHDFFHFLFQWGYSDLISPAVCLTSWLKSFFLFLFFRFIVLLLNIKLYNIQALLFYLICFVRDYPGLLTILRIWKADFNELRLVVLVFF